MANQQIYTTIPMASKHCLPRRGKLRADMKSPSQVALVALLPGERKRQREGRDTARQGKRAEGAYRAESVRLGIEKRQRGAYSEELLSCSYCIRNSLSIGFRHKRKCTKNGKLCKMLQSGKVASRAGCNLALVRSGFDVFSLPKPKTGENCQTKKYCGYSLSFSLSLFLI